MPELKLSSLQPGDALTGTVVSLELAGAFVDVGAGVNGFIHISSLKPRKVNRVDEVLQVGQQVELWVSSVDAAAERLELSMIRPVELKWDEIEPGSTLKGKIVRIEDFGAFVDIGAERHGLVHVSEMSSEYVRDPRQFVSVGDEIEVSVLEVDRKKKQIRLSMKSVEMDLQFEDDEEEEELPTAMELALREAMEGTRRKNKKRRQDQPSEAGESASREQLDDLLSRTLSQRVRTSSKEGEEPEQ